MVWKTFTGQIFSVRTDHPKFIYLKYIRTQIFRACSLLKTRISYWSVQYPLCISTVCFNTSSNSRLPRLSPWQQVGNKDISLAEFRAFLESRGAELAQSQELASLFALPYVPDPANHPSFKYLFLVSLLLYLLCFIF